MKKVSICFIFAILCMLIFAGCAPASNNISSNSQGTEQGGDESSGENSKNLDNMDTNPIIISEGKTLETRFATPDGYVRTPAQDDSLTEFLREYELKEDGSAVLLHDGSNKINQNAHAAVFTLPISDVDLQQCADSVMRIWAEYYWSTGQYDKIAFHFTNGFLCEYSKWLEGYRVVVDENDVYWTQSTGYDDSYETFEKYLHKVFSYAGTMSMDAYESETIAMSELETGDVIIKGGSPGHVVMVVDVCENTNGEKAFLLAQGYMPAQEFHVIQNPAHKEDPWYYETEISFPLRTAEYTFEDESMIKRLKYEAN